MKSTKKTTRPQPPETLDGEGLLEWHRIVDELDDAGRLDKADRALLTLYAQTWEQYQAAIRGVAKYGAVIKYTSNVGPSPHYKVAKELAAQLRGLLNDLGLTPASRKLDAAAQDQGELQF
jgi:P27 family predicted phage terminase small subunit